MTTIEVLNQIDAVPESSVVIDVAMSNPIYRGPKGEPGDDYTLTAEDIAEIAGEIDLSEYAKLDDIPDMSEYALLTDIPDTSNFITADDLPDTTGFATEEFVNEKISEIPSPDLSEYAKISDIPDTSNNATFEYVDEAVEMLENGIEEIKVLKLYTDIIPTAEQWELLKTMANTGTFPCPIFMDDLPVLSYERSGSLSWGSLSLNLIYGKPMTYQNSNDTTMGLQYAIYNFKTNDVPALPRLITTAYLSEDYISLKSSRTPNGAKRLNEVLVYLDDNKADVSTLENYYNKTEVDGLIPDTSNHATFEYVDEAISNIDIPEAEIVDEVYIGSTAPTDENIKVWIDPSAQLEFATKGYVDEAISNIDIPEGNSSEELIIVPTTLSSATSALKQEYLAFKQKMLEVFATGSVKNYIFKNQEGQTLTADISNNGTKITFSAIYYGQASDIRIQNGAYTKSQAESSSFGELTLLRDALFQNQLAIPLSKNWYWISNAEGNYITGIGDYTHIKVQGFWDGNTSRITTIDISTSNNSYFYSENGVSYIQSVGYNGYYIEAINDGSSLTFYLYDMYGNTPNENFNILGYYYWG